jgi:hypothetical protein
MLGEMGRDAALVRGDLEERIDEARRSRLLFVVGTVLVTPFLVGLAIGIAIYALGRMSTSFYLSERSFAGGLAVGLVVAVLVQLFRPKPAGRSPSEWRSLFLGAGCAVGVVVLAAGVRGHGAAYWLVFGALGFAALGFMGRAYSPRESYYMGWFTTNLDPDGLDDPFTVRDNLDRADFWTGWAVALPGFVFECYADVFGSGWAFRAPSEAEHAIAYDVVHALATRDLPAARRAAERSARIVRVLHEAELVRPSRQGLRLSDDGLRLVGLKS